MNTFTTHLARAAGGILLLMNISSVHAQIGIYGSASGSVSAPGVNVELKGELMVQAKMHADQEIDRRIKALNDLSARVNMMQKVSADQKSSLQTSIQAQISALTTLKAKVDSDSDATALRTDIKSITGSYRIFALIIPQAAITAAADRTMNIASSMATLQAKLQTRITEAQSEGHNVSALQSAYADMSAKIMDANVKTQAAITTTASLKPDQGNQSQFDANHQTLVSARANIRAATADLKAARKDAMDIMKGLKAFSASGSASGTVQTYP